MRRVQLSAGVTVEQALATYSGQPGVKYAEPDWIVGLNVIPNDPNFGQEYGLNNTGQSGGTADADVYKFLRYFSFLSVDEIAVIEEADKTREGKPEGQRILAEQVTALVHGQLGAAFSYNPGAFLVVATALVLLVAWRWQRVRIPMWAVFVFFGALWAFQLFKYATGRPL